MPEAPKLESYTNEQPVVWIPFSAYELANILSMFRALWPHAHGVLPPHDSPLTVFNSGDWVSVLYRFQEAFQLYGDDRLPNRSPEEYIAEARAWCEQ